MPETRTSLHVCAACDAQVSDDHPGEWMCSATACGVWFHVTENRCPQCGAAPFDGDVA